MSVVCCLFCSLYYKLRQLALDASLIIILHVIKGVDFKWTDQMSSTNREVSTFCPTLRLYKEKKTVAILHVWKRNKSANYYLRWEKLPSHKLTYQFVRKVLCTCHSTNETSIEISSNKLARSFLFSNIFPFAPRWMDWLITVMLFNSNILLKQLKSKKWSGEKKEGEKSAMMKIDSFIILNSPNCHVSSYKTWHVLTVKYEVNPTWNFDYRICRLIGSLHWSVRPQIWWNRRVQWPDADQGTSWNLAVKGLT